MKIKISDITKDDYFYRHVFLPWCREQPCDDCPCFHNLFKVCMIHEKGCEDVEVCIPDEYFDQSNVVNKKSGNEKESGSTFWNGQISQNDYRLQFQTSDKDLYKIVEAAAQLAVDMSNKKKEEQRNESN